MKALLRLAGLMAVSAAAAGAQTVYTNDGSSVAGFGVNTKVWLTPTNCTSGTYCGSYIGANDVATGYSGGGEGHPFADLDVARLTLSGLGSHTGGTLFFTLFVIDSWDGEGFGCCGPDIFQVYVNGAQVFNKSFTDPAFSATEFQSFPDPYAGGTGTNLPGTGATENGTLGFFYWSGGGSDHNSVYEIAIPFTDALSLVDIDFTASSDNQGFLDESWGLRGVRVDLSGGVTATPEPASLTLMATGLVGLGVAVRRRKKAHV